MIKKLSVSYRVVLTALLAMALLVVPLTAVYAQGTNSSDTMARGYQLINGDVYDLHGNLLIKMHDGRTPDGYTLDPNFTVYDASTDANTQVLTADNTVSPDSIVIYSGTKNLNLNVDGNQGVQLGSDFTVSSSQPNVRFTYSSGVPSGVNFAVDNVTRGTTAGWVSNLQPGHSKSILVYNGSPSDTYRVKASAQGSAGTATVEVEKL